MVSLKSVAAVAVFLTSVAAQNNYTVDITKIDAPRRAAWCSGQENTCGTLCDGNANNSCNAVDLTYTCLCNSNKSAPGLQYYVPSMPTYLCNEVYAVCNLAETSAAGKAKCLENQKANCGTIPIANYVSAPETTSSASNSATAAPTGTAAGNGAAPTTTSTSAGLAPTMVAGLGAGVFAVGMAAFGVML